MPEYIPNFKEIQRSILNARTIAISGHANPDGDSIGSLLAMGLALDDMGKKVYMLCQDEIPANYRSLPGARRIVKTTKEKVDLAIAVDCSSFHLLGRNIPVFKKAKSILEIDHHEYRQPFGSMMFLDHDAAAVGEQIHILLEKLKIGMTRDIAENILTSIIVETNLFKLSNVRPLTFKVCSELLKTGLVFSNLVDSVYGPKTKEAMTLSATCLLRAKFLQNGRIIWSEVRDEDLASLGAKSYDTDAIATDLISMKGVEIAVLFRRRDKHTLRVSLRSKGGINVGRLAEECNGGGHFDIAGCYIPDNKKSMKEILASAESLLDRTSTR